VDDLPRLGELWANAHLAAGELEKQFTDFQVAEDETGQVVAAVALHIEGSHGRVHSETFADFGLTDTLRPALWQRLQTVAQNHGLFRLWTLESAPWWKKGAGFSAVTDDILLKLPASYGERSAAWLTLRLKDESADPDRLDKELAAFKEAEKLRREKLLYRGQVVRIIATLISALVLIGALILLIWVVKHRR